MSQPRKTHPVALAIGIMACNEEASLAAALRGLRRQSVFERLAARHERGEVVVVAHGCTDRTAAVVRAVCAEQAGTADAAGFTARVVEVPEAGQADAWNRFVHEFSAVEARCLVSMDADVLFHHRDALLNLMAALERQPRVQAAVGRRCSDLIFKERKTLRERLSLAHSTAQAADGGKAGGQLYALRADAARTLFLPRDVGAARWGFIREMIGTAGLTRAFAPGRIAVAADAAHIVATAVQARAVIDSQKRQLMGETAVHVLVEHLRTLPWAERPHLAETLRQAEAADPDWLKKLIAAHLRRRRFFWQIIPRSLTSRFQWLGGPAGAGRIARAPAAVAGFCITLVACARASRALRRGLTAAEPHLGGPRRPVAASLGTNLYSR